MTINQKRIKTIIIKQFMKLSSSGAPKYGSTSTSYTSFPSKNMKTFHRISPFELRPQGMSEGDKDTLYRHLCEIKASFAQYKHYFIDNKLYKLTQLVDKEWQISWFGFCLPLQEVVDDILGRYGDHPSQLKEIFIYHKENQSLGKPITSLILIFENLFWLKNQAEFSVDTGDKTINAIAKPAWNTDRVRQIFKSIPEDSKIHYLKNQIDHPDNEIKLKGQDEVVDQTRKLRKLDILSSQSGISSPAETIFTGLKEHIQEKIQASERRITEKLTNMEEELLGKLLNALKNDKTQRQPRAKPRSVKKEDELSQADAK